MAALDFCASDPSTFINSPTRDDAEWLVPCSSQTQESGSTGRLPHSLNPTLTSPQSSNDVFGRLWRRPLVEGTERQTLRTCLSRELKRETVLGPGSPAVAVLSVSVRASITVVKHCDQKTSSERKGLTQLTLPYYCSSLKEGRTGTQGRQEPGGRN